MLNNEHHAESFSSLTVEDRAKLSELKQRWPVPKFESKRLQVLREAKLLNYENEADLYQRYTILVNRLFNVPVVLVSLMDIDRQRFLAKIGIDHGSELPREGSLCNNTLLEGSPIVIATEDAATDDRFAGNNFKWIQPSTAVSVGSRVVTTAEKLRSHDSTVQEHADSPSAERCIHFYASVALVVDGMKIGTLSLYDCVPRPDLVAKAIKLLPDFGKIISDAMNRRHKLEIGPAGSELANLTMTVMYNLKFPIAQVQRSLSKLKSFVTFQPSKRVIKVPPPSTCGCSTTADAQEKAGQKPTGGDISTCLHGLHGKTRMKKVFDFDTLCGEKDAVLKEIFELKSSTATLIKVLDYSLNLAHSLQGLYQRRRNNSVTSNVVYNNIAPRKASADELFREKKYQNSHLTNRVKKAYNNFIHAQMSNETAAACTCTCTIDPVLMQCIENDNRKYQFNSHSLTLALYGTLFHLSQIPPATGGLGHIDVEVRFEERDYIASQLLHMSSPGGGGGSGMVGNRIINSHKNTSPGSSKSAADSAKTRLPSFSNPVVTNIMQSLAEGGGGGGGGGIADDRKGIANVRVHSSPAGSDGGNVPSPRYPAQRRAQSPAAVDQDGAHKIPAPISIPSMFMSPRTSLNKPNAAQVTHGDIFMTFHCSSRQMFHDDGDGGDAGTTLSNKANPSTEASIAAAAASRKHSYAGLWSPSVDVDIFENVILKNILSVTSGGFQSSSGAVFCPEAPTTAGLVGSLFSPSGRRGQFGGGVSASGGHDGISTLPPSLKFNPSNTRENVHEDSQDDGDVFIVTVRIPCNIITPNPAQHGANSRDGSPQTARTTQQMRSLPPTVLGSTSSESSCGQMKIKKLSNKGTPVGLGSSSRLTPHTLSNSSKHASATDFTHAPSCSSIDQDSAKAAGINNDHRNQPLTPAIRNKPTSAHFSSRGMVSTLSFDEFAEEPVAGTRSWTVEAEEDKAALTIKVKHTHTATNESGAANVPIRAHQRSKLKPGHAGAGNAGKMKWPSLRGALSSVASAVFGRESNGSGRSRKVAMETINVNASTASPGFE